MYAIVLFYIVIIKEIEEMCMKIYKVDKKVSVNHTKTHTYTYKESQNTLGSE